MKNKIILLALYNAIAVACFAQTDMDAIMMGKNQLCIGPAYTNSSWTNYWEGTLKRNNENLGRVTSQTFSLMGNYGLTDKINLLFNVPYVKTKASAGTLHGMSGLQDLNLFVKYMPIEKDFGKGTFSLYTIGGVSLPMSNYVADYLPLSIGLRSKTASLRLMADYQVNSFFATASATWVLRDNIQIDRTGYYTTQPVLSNEVEMPNATTINVRVGHRSERLIAELVLNSWTTHGGFDISRNNMPFPSNKMNATSIGVNGKYVIYPKHELALIGGVNTVVAGRNVGQSTNIYGGIFYVVEFAKRKKKTEKPAAATPVK